MASSSNFLIIIGIILAVNLTQVIGGENIVLEEGYTVTTVIDGDKLNVNPYAVFSTYGSSSDLIILDSVKSTFYTVSFSNSQVNEVNKLSGNANGNAGYKDGDLGSAEFNKPKSFAIDKKNNIYIADKSNHVIRKISKSGVTTIAGGNLRKTGKADGPAQNASFSDDFELAFDSQRCALLISDHGNRLIRQLDLKAEDCADTSSGSVLGSTIALGVGVVVACLIGVIIGFVIRPYALPYTGNSRLSSGQHDMEAFPNQSGETGSDLLPIASHNLYQILKKFLILSFSQLSLLFRFNIIRPPTVPKKPVSLLDCDNLINNETTETHDVSLLDCDDLTTETRDLVVDELTDLISFDGTGNPKLCLNEDEEKKEVVENGGKIDKHIYANLVDFVEGGKNTSSVGSRDIGS